MKKTALLMLSLIFFISAANVYAANFRDVPPNHFAADAIRWVSSPANGSYMVGDASNNFNPNRTLDTFETAIIMAVAEGFRYTTGTLTPAEQAVFDRAYQRHRVTLSDMEARHPNWRRAANREIAFLLERGILTESDLELFMTRAAVGGEAPAPLTKEMLSAFILRLSNNHEHEINLPDGFSFNDDGDLSEMYRRYAYLAYQLGILGTYDGDFSPQRAITRAEFAQISYDLRISPFAEAEIPVTSPTPTPTPESTPAPNPEPEPEPAQTASPFADTLHGVVSAVAETSIDIRTDEGLDTHRFAGNTVIVIDDERSNISDLREGMLVAIGVNNDREIISLLARSYQAAEVSLPPRGERPEVVLPSFITDGPALTVDPVPSPPLERLIPDTPVGLQEPVFASVFFRGEGIVTALPEEAIVINIHTLHIATGEVTEEERRFTIANNASITRGSSPISLEDIQIGEIVSFDYAEDILYALRLPEEDIPPVIYGTLEKIIITEDIYSILLRVNEGITELMTLPVEVYDIYALRLGMELRVSLDNQVIYDLEILGQTEQGGGEGFIAYVQSLRHGHTIVVSEEGRRRNIRVGSSTINTATGESLRFRDLRSQMRLYIVLAENSDTARSVTILP